MTFRLIAILSSALFLNSCSTSSSKSGAKGGMTSGHSPTQAQALERQISIEVDKRRRAKGFAPLKYDERIANIAREHSRNLAKRSQRSGRTVIDHKGFSGRSNQMLLDLNMLKLGENVGFLAGVETQRAQEFTRMWMKSSEHRANIFSKWNYNGVGVVVTSSGAVFVTHLFGLKTDFSF